MIKVVDLFSGAGGLTFGFQKKVYRNRFVNDDRFNVVFANEYDHEAAEAFRINFPNIPMLEEDISNIDEEYLANMYLELKNVDLVIGGPPCQSFSTVGRRQYDNRAKMYKEYRRILSIIRPKVFIFENVLGLLTMKNDKQTPVIEDVEKSFEDFSDFEDNLSYTIHKKVLNAHDFGVPQSRERVFLVGVRKDLTIKKNWEFPSPVNSKKITVKDAISDLPFLVNGSGINKYQKKPETKYQYLMRGNQKILNNHVSGYNGERMQKIIEAVIEGEGRPYINKLVDEGKLPQELYLTSGYRNTYGRLWWDKPSTTITNNLSTPSSLRCIHPKQNRALTSREGARLQSFPDDFVFVGPKNKINSQVGNAVPPLLSIHLANSIYDFVKQNFRE
ncbi:DNA cytosine methyltransferase [Enterococcus hulanensis]|uniref:DNA cytosine methyltransferase n=1 Tax=Enterococcus hulanensis TaxID=2559929 RepID=UPI0028915FAA|nr:DNA cytosine methyltransferase [Enterococcus hulanensis]MDT2662542.1 DNA cytosine methyltransferase [Enterococcus hulanensis]